MSTYNFNSSKIKDSVMGDNAKYEKPDQNQLTRRYQATIFEKVACLIIGTLILCAVLFIIIRNEPLVNPNFYAQLKIMLSISMAMLGSIVPGLLHVNMKGSGLIIRATGAIALFVITFFFSPQILEENPQTKKPAVELIK